MSSFKPIDDRQVLNRAILQQLFPWVGSQTLDVLMSSINSELTPPLSVTATSSPSLVVNVGSAIVANSESDRNHSAPFINGFISSFTSGTVTFPSASGGNITTSTGGSYLLTLPSNDYVQVVLALNQSSQIVVTIGTPNSVEADAAVPSPMVSTLPFAWITLFNNAGTIQNITQSNIFQLSGGSGSGGSGSGTGKNYLSVYTASTSNGVPNVGNGNFELGAVTGWSLVNSVLSGVTPTSAASPGSAFSSSSGGSPASANLSLFIVSSGQLAGAFSGDLSSSSTSIAGDMLISNAFFIDLEDQARMMQITFDYKSITGVMDFSGTSSNSFAVWIYDVTNAAWIQPQGVYDLVQGSGVGLCTATFQTTSNSTQYQLALININSISTSYSLYIDDFFLGPQIAPIGPAIADWQPYTPTITGAGTVTNSSSFWSRVGDSVQLKINFSCGTPSSSIATITLPPGLSYDVTKLGTAFNNLVGYGVQGASSIAADQQIVLATSTTSSNILNIAVQSGSSGGTNTTGVAGTAIFTTGRNFSFETILIPVAGWSSNSVASSDTDTRVVAAEVTQTANISVTAGSPIVFPFATYDTHAAYNNTTGAYVVPVSGYYDVLVAGINYGVTNASLFLVKNGNAVIRITDSVSGSTTSGSTQVQCNAGDSLTLVFDGSSTLVFIPFSGSDVGSSTTVTFSRRSGPAVVTATESVNASYYASTNTTSTTSAPIDWDTKIYDSHNAVTTGSSWKFTCPVSGKYRFSFFTNSLTAVNSNFFVYINGSPFKVIGAQPATFGEVVSGGTVQLNAGDFLDIRSGTSSTYVGGTLSSGATNFDIERVGN